MLQFTGEVYVPERGLYIQTVGSQPLQYEIFVNGMLTTATNTLNPLNLDPGWYSIRCDPGARCLLLLPAAAARHGET